MIPIFQCGLWMNYLTHVTVKLSPCYKTNVFSATHRTLAKSHTKIFLKTFLTSFLNGERPKNQDSDFC